MMGVTMQGICVASILSYKMHLDSTLDVGALSFSEHVK